MRFLKFLLVTLSLLPALQAQKAPDLIRQTIDRNRRTTLEGNTRPEAIPANDRGLVADNLPLHHIHLVLTRSAEQQAALDHLIQDLHNPDSPQFHRWLTATEFGERFSLSRQDLDTITQWLESEGFAINVVYPHGVLDISGTAGQVRSAFRTEIHHLEVNGDRHIANMSDPSIPAALAPAIRGIVSLHDFRPHRRPKVSTSYNPGDGTYPLSPQDLQAIYGLTPLFTRGISGQGQSIALIENTYLYDPKNAPNTGITDWQSFRNTFGLSGYGSGSLTQVAPAPGSGSNNCPAPSIDSSSDIEAALDVEWASAAAPGSSLILAACPDSTTTVGVYIALPNLLSGPNPPAVIGISWGQSETLNEANMGAAANYAVNLAYQMAVTEGVSIFVSAGDAGADIQAQGSTYSRHGINVNGWASTPYNVAVGGTDFADTYLSETSKYWNQQGYATGYIPEIPWNESCGSTLIASWATGSALTYGASGFCNASAGHTYLSVVAGSGGPSSCATGSPLIAGQVSGTCQGYAKPSWQSVFGNPNDGVRDIPDVALFASSGTPWKHAYIICFSDPDDSTQSGRPCTPNSPGQWTRVGGTSASAPVMAGIQALVNQYTGSRWGNPNETYYKLARAEYGATGNSGCNSTGQNAPGSMCIFNDITIGDINVPCRGTNCYRPAGSYGVLSMSPSTYQPAFTAGPGWDFATGLGSVNAYNLVMNWPQPVSVSAAGGTPQSAVIGNVFTTPFAASVRDGSGNPVAGITVTFAVPAGGASCVFSGGVNTATTDSNGMATSPLCTANSTAGSYTVTASASSSASAASFVLTNSPPSSPSLSVASSHSGSFTQGQGGAVYLLTVSSTGTQATSGTVTVTDTLPAGLVATAISGAGWTCSVASLSCGRGDSLSPGSAYPPITLTVTVANDAPSTVVNTVAVSGGGSAAASASDPTTIVALSGQNPLQLITVTPCRVLDTRNPAGTFGAPFLSAGASRMIPIPAGACNIPSTAAAYSLNITVVPRNGRLGYLTIWPASSAQPVVSTLNSPDGSVIANAAIVAAGSAGAISAYASDDTELIIDVNGYFAAPTSSSLQFYPLTPCRVLDTRNATGTLGGPAIAGGTARAFPITSSSCGIPTNAAAYSLNLTAIPHGSLAYLSAWATGQPQPLVSTLNSLDGTVLANAAIVPAGTGGSVTFYASNTADLAVDIDGYFAPTSSDGLNFYSTTPCRLVDTRTANGPLVAAGMTRSFVFTGGVCAPPTNALAYSLNFTVVPQTTLGYMTIWPAGGTQPMVSTLNDSKGQIMANAAITPAGSNGAIEVFVTNNTQVIIDLDGYFGK